MAAEKTRDVAVVGAGPAGMFVAHGAKCVTDRHLETNVPNLFVAGDGAGKSRGIVGAALNGCLAAEGILRKEGKA